jgi:hypothetical protein
MINIVTTENINNLIKSKSKYYRTNLGFVNTIEQKSGDRTLNDKDQFVFLYVKNGGNLLYSKGTIGKIRFYVDYHIKNNMILFFYGKDKYEFEPDMRMITEQGSDFYIGHLIKKIETEMAEKVAQIEEQKKQQSGDPNRVLTNPGEVTYEDVKAYLEKQRLERLKVKK